MTLVVVSGALANKPLNGGEAWVRLSWILGFRQLGYDVAFVEQIAREACTDAGGRPVPLEASLNLDYFRRVTAHFGLSNRAALIDVDRGQIHGLDRAQLFDIARVAELLVNISGHLTWQPLLHHFRRKAYVDIDPGFTQFWHADPAVDFSLDDHDFYYTIGERIGRPDCPIPAGGIEWRPIRQPVVLDDWPVLDRDGIDRFTTVASWRGAYGPVWVGEKVYGVKAHAFRQFLALPQHSPHTFEIALDIHPGDINDRMLLLDHGWRLADPLTVAADPLAFRQYIQESAAEFSAAQAIYAETRCGWFSDRTTRYLASGKPALVQETGFSEHLPTGEGLLSFNTLEEAEEGVACIRQNYAAHRRAARELAERYFDSRKILHQMSKETGISP